MKKWTKERDAELTRMWLSGEKNIYIEAVLGISRKSLSERRQFLGLHPRTAPHLWHEEDVREAVRLWDKGLTARQIGRRIGRSVNAVNSKIAKERASGGVSFHCPHISSKNRNGFVREIQKAVSKEYQVSVKAILGRSRLRFINEPRQIAIALSRRICGRSLPGLAADFNRDDHTTMLHAIRMAESKHRDILDRMERRLVARIDRGEAA